MKLVLFCGLLALPFARDGIAARLVSVMTCRDVNQQGTLPIGIQEEFATDAPAVHVVAVLNDVTPGTAVKVVWMSVNAIDVPNYAIDSAEVVASEPESRAHFSLSRPNNGWPAGDYQALLYVNGGFVTGVPFRINAESQAQTQANTPSASSPVIGCWNCQDGGETSTLEFREDNVMLYDGEAVRYALSQSSIQIETEFGPIDYPYAIQGNSLTLVFPGGYQVSCARTRCGGRSGAQQQPQSVYQEERVQPQPGMQSGGNEPLLRGMFCHWGGSSSSYSGSSYSHSTQVNFDGQGRFSTGSESSYSGNEGIAYGGGGDGGGTYRIVGNEVHLTFNDGSTGVAQIYNRAGDGSVTELMYNGDLYAPQLCD